MQVVDVVGVMSSNELSNVVLKHGGLNHGRGLITLAEDIRGVLVMVDGSKLDLIHADAYSFGNSFIVVSNGDQTFQIIH